MQSSFRSWLPVVGLTLSAFVFNTSEFMPIGLLSDIASDFHLTEAKAGMLISVYAWMVALLSLPLMLAVCRMEMRKLLLCIIGLFVISHLFSSISTTYYQLMASRIGVAAAHSIFWSIASPMAVRTVPQDKRAVAISIVAMGSAVAMVVGLPLGRIIGMYVGWRTTFLSIAIVAALIACYIMVVFPKLPNRDTFSVKKMPTILRDPVLMGIFVATVFFATGHYVGYSYIEPFLGQIALLKGNTITIILTFYGVSGAIGSVVFSRYYNKRPLTFITISIILVALSLAALLLSVKALVALLVVCLLWSGAATAFNVAFQDTIIRNAKAESTSIAMSIFSGIFNLGIGCGAFIGGRVCNDLSIRYIGYFGGAITICAAIIFACDTARRLQKIK